MTGLDPATVKRLTFIRLIYQQGVEQSQRPEPLSMTSILSFHDAVELFLVLAGEHLKANPPEKTPFMDYWTFLSPSKTPDGVNLIGRASMGRLNRLRNGFKHAGTLPGAAAVEQARVETTAFFTDNTPLVFGPDVDFTSLDMADLVTQPAARDKLRAAANSASQDDYAEAIGLLTEAFDDLLNDYAESKKLAYNRSAFGFGERLQDFPPVDTSALERVLGHRFAEHYMQLAGAAAEMQRSMRVIALGLDYRHYARFAMVTPDIIRGMNGGVDRQYTPGLPITRDNYEFCREFVVTTSLRLAEVDFNLDLPELNRAWRQETFVDASVPQLAEPPSRNGEQGQ